MNSLIAILFLASSLGLTFGIIALWKINKSPGTDGPGLAMGGLVTSGLGLIISVATVLSGIVPVGQPETQVEQVQSRKPPALPLVTNQPPAINQLPDVAPPSPGSDPPRLYVDDRGIHFEVFDQDELPYRGNVFTYHDRDQKIVASEKVYENGLLRAEREYWPNGNYKSEISYNLGGSTTNRYDQQGNEIKPPSIAATRPVPQTRTLNWTYNYNAGNARLEALIGKSTALLIHYLGEPNDKLNNVWTYRNMRITDGRTGRQNATVSFNISGTTVSSIALQQ